MRLRPTALAVSVLTSIAVSMVGLPALGATAGPGDDLAEKRRQLESQIAEHEAHVDGASRAYTEAVEKLRGLQAQLTVARAEVAAVRGQLAAARARAAALAEKLRLAEAAVAKAGAEIEVLRGRISASQDELGQLARTAYQDGTPGTIAIYLDASSVDDMFNRMAYTESASQSETAILRELADARADAAAREATLDAKRAEVAALKAEAVATVDRTRTLEAAAVRAEAHSAGLVRAADEAAKVIAAERAAEIRRMQEAQVEADKISALLAERARQAKARAAAAAAAAARAAEAERARAEQERQRSSGGNKASQAQPRRQSQPAPPASAGSILMRPVDGPVSSPFGMRVHPITGVYKLHDGTDFGGGCGTPIYAAASGTVIESGYYGAWGNRAVVDHGLVGGVGLATAYNHMTTIVATSGSVRRGDLVGYMGSTGYSTGCHLHLNVYVDGTPVDPMRYL